MSDSEEESQPRRRQRISERLDDIAQLPNAGDTEDERTQNNSQNTGSGNGRIEQQITNLMSICRRRGEEDHIQDQLRTAFPTLDARGTRSNTRSNDTTLGLPRGPRTRNILRDPEDRRRAADVSVRMTALDKPTYQSTAVVNLAKLRRIGLGRTRPETIRIPASTTTDEFRELVRTHFPVLRDRDFEVLVGRRGCTMEAIPIPDANHINELRVCRGAVPIWIRPKSEIDQVPIETGTLHAPMMEDPPADLQTQVNDAHPEEREDEHLDESDEEGTRETVTLPALLMEDRPADRVPLLDPQTQVNDAHPEEREDEHFHLHLDVSGDENTVPNGYVEAGTPTVLLRAIPRTVLDVTREVAGSEVHTEDEEIPEVRTSSSETSVTVTTGFREKVREHATLFIRGDYEDPLSLEVRRNHVLIDALHYIRVAQDDLHSPLLIRFLGEEGVDLGGLRREFWALFLHQVTHSSLVAGRPGRLTFRRNYLEQKKSTFFYLGQMAALSVLEDGPGLPIFGDGVANHILKRHVLDVDEGDLPEHIQQLVQEMNQTDNDEDLRHLYMQVMEDANEAGFLIPATRFTKAHIPSLVGAIVENSVHSCRVELEQFQEGLKTHQVLDLLRSEPEDSIGLLSGRRKPVTVAAIRELLHIHYRDGNLGEVDRQTTHGFLAFLQATKGSSAAVNGLQLSPQDVLMWLSGSSAIPAVGFHKLIDVEFGDSCRVNTCALVVTLTQLPPTVDDVVQYYTELVINSQTFQVQ